MRFRQLNGEIKSKCLVTVFIILFPLQKKKKSLSKEFRVVLACPRGCGDSTLGSRPYNARDAKDHLIVLEHVHKRFPKSKIFAVGFSLGANLLVNALADYANHLDFVSGAAALGSPW